MNTNYRILRNYLFVELVKKITLHEKNENEKINLITELARFMSNNVTGKYSDFILEKELIDAGKKIKFSRSIETIPNTVLHVMTAAGMTGGHTRVVNNWIEFDRKRQHSVVFTTQKSSVPKFLKDAVDKSGGKIYYLTGNNKQKQAENLLNISSSFEKVVLSIHMYDPIPIIAYSNKNWTTPIYFYNHAEFRFWLGVSIADLVFDVSTEDRKKSIKDRGIRNTRLLPIPIKSKENCSVQYKEKNITDVKAEYNLPRDAKIITSMAEDYKYTVVNGYDFPQFMIELIKKDPNIYTVIIGGNPKEKKWEKLIKTSRARVLGRLDLDEVNQILSFTDVYIDSFPLPSYTCSLEAIAKKIPVVGYDIKGYQLDALKSVKCNNMIQLMDKTLLYLQNKELYNYENINKRIEFYHYKAHWLEMMETSFNINLRHRVHKFKSKFVIGEFERLNVTLGSFEKKEHNDFFNGLSNKNTNKIKILAKLLNIDLK